MSPRGRPRLRRLRDELARAHPSLDDPEAAIERGAIAVDGHVVSNPASLVRENAAITIVAGEPLRGEAKLNAALVAFDVVVRDRVALDAGAAAGGFVRALLDAGARRVYAVDAGFGQLLGSLRQDARVVNLERTNLGELDRKLVPDAVEVVTLDLSYLSLARAVPQLAALELAVGCELVALVKPMFELALDAPPDDEPSFERAVELAIQGIAAAGWTVRGSMRSPVRGTRGSTEFFVSARRELQ